MKEFLNTLFFGPFFACSRSDYRFILIFILILLIDIGDFIVTYLGYNGDIKEFFITRFIFQGIFIFYDISLTGAISFRPADRDEALISGIPFIFMFLVMLVFEIISLIFYIIEFSNISDNAKIGYYIHFSHFIFAYLVGRNFFYLC